MPKLISSMVWSALLVGALLFSTQAFASDRVVLASADKMPPIGKIITPTHDQAVGKQVEIEAEVIDTESGVYSVTFRIDPHTQPMIRVNATDADGDGIYTAVWNSNGFNDMPVLIDGVTVDKAGNKGKLAPIPSVQVDHVAPTARMIYPSEIAADAGWINTNGSIQVSADASDPHGIAQVEFVAVYRDANQQIIEQQLLSDATRPEGGYFTAIWDVTQIPDQIDRQFEYDVQIKAIAVDTAGNRSAESVGYFLGLDREPPTVEFIRPRFRVRQFNSVYIEVGAGDTYGMNNQVKALTVSARYQAPGQTRRHDHVLAQLTDTSGWNGTLSLVGLPDQIVTLMAEAVDEAGNRHSTSFLIRIDSTPTTFTNVSHSSDPFYTNGTGNMSFSFTVSENASVTVYIENGSGQLVNEIHFSPAFTTPQIAVWDGLDWHGQPVPTGTYRYWLQARDIHGNINNHPGDQFEIVFDNVRPSLTLKANPNPFYFSQGEPLEIEFEQDEAGYAEIEIFDASGNMVNFFSRQMQAGGHQWLWDGEDFLGMQVPTGAEYTISLRVTDLARNVSTERTVVRVEQ
ncbi:MAG: FlgD immunoglobulin-like domain containing protein [Chloroflexota bacterium]